MNKLLGLVLLMFLIIEVGLYIYFEIQSDLVLKNNLFLDEAILQQKLCSTETVTDLVDKDIICPIKVTNSWKNISGKTLVLDDDLVDSLLHKKTPKEFIHSDYEELDMTDDLLKQGYVGIRHILQ